MSTAAKPSSGSKKNRSLVSNWGTLKSKLTTEESTSLANTKTNASSKEIVKEKRTDLTQAYKGDIVSRREPQKKEKEHKLAGDHMNSKMKSNYVGLDCEMVGIGPSGKQSALARCCIVDFEGLVIYDKYVRPKGFVTDFRTQWSGIRKQDLRAGEAITLLECQEDVASILKTKFLVGHALKNDLDVLMLSHPRKMIRDTATYKPYMRPHGRKGGKFKPRSLKELTRQHLGIQIQGGEHDPGEDARSAMFLYRLKMREWEDSVKAVRNTQIAAFKNKLQAGGVEGSESNTASSSSSSSAKGDAEGLQSDTGKADKPDKEMSAKDRRNLRRNGPPTPIKPISSLAEELAETSRAISSKISGQDIRKAKERGASSSMFANDGKATSFSEVDRGMKRSNGSSSSSSNDNSESRKKIRR